MRLFLIFSFYLFLGACQQTTSTPKEFNKESTALEVKEMLQRFLDDIKKDGLTSEFKYLDNSPDFFWVPPGYQSAITYDSVSTVLRSNAGVFRSIDYHWEHLKINALSNEIANYTGIVKGSMIDTAGNTFPVNMIESGTLIKRSDGWKILSGQSRKLVD